MRQARTGTSCFMHETQLPPVTKNHHSKLIHRRVRARKAWGTSYVRPTPRRTKQALKLPLLPCCLPKKGACRESETVLEVNATIAVGAREHGIDRCIMRRNTGGVNSRVDESRDCGGRVSAAAATLVTCPFRCAVRCRNIYPTKLLVVHYVRLGLPVPRASGDTGAMSPTSTHKTASNTDEARR